MNKTLVIIIIIITSLLAGFFFSQVDEKSSSSSDVAIFNNELVTEDLLKEMPKMYAADASEDDIKKLKLALYVEKKLLPQLASEYNIDQSREAVLSFIKVKISPFNLQKNAQRLTVKAMREVVINGRSEKDVYNEYFNGKGYKGLFPSSLDEWKERVKLYGKKELIEFYELELKKKVEDISTSDFIFYKKRYLEQKLKSAYCKKEDIFKSLPLSFIIKNSKFVQQEAEYKCTQVFYPWLLSETTKRVEVIDKKYKGFEVYLSSYIAVQLMKADNRTVRKNE